MITATKLSARDKPTKEQLERIERAAKLPIVSDEDCPVYTAEQLARLYAETREVLRGAAEQISIA